MDLQQTRVDGERELEALREDIAQKQERADAEGKVHGGPCVPAGGIASAEQWQEWMTEHASGDRILLEKRDLSNLCRDHIPHTQTLTLLKCSLTLEKLHSLMPEEDAPYQTLMLVNCNLTDVDRKNLTEASLKQDLPAGVKMQMHQEGWVLHFKWEPPLDK